MTRMLTRGAAMAPAMVAVLWAAACAGEAVVLRNGDGRFLRVGESGSLQADQLFPADAETFELLTQQDNRLVVKARQGCVVTIEGQDHRRVRCGNPAVEQPVEVYRIFPVPDAMRSALAGTIRGLATERLAGKEYDKLTTRKHDKYVELPAPTLHNLKQKKRHRVLSTEEQYHLQARLDGPLDIQLMHMPYLSRYGRTGAGVLLFVVEASVPVQGRAEYKIPEIVGASTGFRALVGLSVVGELRAEQVDDRFTLLPPKLLAVRAELRSLDFSNDVLHVVRRQIKEIINHELQENHDRIQQQANEAVGKAMEPRQFRSPLLRWLSLL